MTDTVPDRANVDTTAVKGGMELNANTLPSIGDLMVESEMRWLRARDRIAMLTAVLQGVRGMAETEAANGSNAWRKAVAMIDEALK